jgi:hypothetical protein
VTAAVAIRQTLAGTAAALTGAGDGCQHVNCRHRRRRLFLLLLLFDSQDDVRRHSSHVVDGGMQCGLYTAIRRLYDQAVDHYLNTSRYVRLPQCKSLLKFGLLVAFRCTSLASADTERQTNVLQETENAIS